MLNINLNLPARRRLTLQFAKRRKSLDDKPLIPPMGEVLRTKKGNKVSRFFRHVFEHKNIKKILGGNIALAIIATSIIPGSTNFDTTEAEPSAISIETTNFATERTVANPTTSTKVSQGYSFYHPGIDFDGVTGDPVNPAMPGTVSAIQYSKYAYGNAVIVDHGQDITTLYAHLSKITTSIGQNVDTYSKIGEVGATGHASGDHLHFEVRTSGVPINPYSILPR